MNNENIRKQFVWFKNNPDYVYMDSGATTLKPKCVIDAILEYYEKYSSNPHNIDSKLTYQVYDKVQQTRKKLANLINANEDEIAFCSGATEGLNLIANGLKEHLKPGDQIVLTYGEHASNILPWMKIAEEKQAKIVYAGKKFQIPSVQDFVDALTPKTKIVAFASGFNVTGTKLNENIISNEIKKYNPDIFVVVDAVQSIQHRKLDVKSGNYDFLVCSAHKMFGPTGVGGIYLKKSLQNKIQPLRYGGGMNFSITENNYTLLDSIEKYEGGTPNVAGIYAWATALDFLDNIGYEFIKNYELELANYAREQLRKIDNVIIYNDDIDSPTIAINYKGVFSQDLASYLGNKKIIVRSGLSCAKLICNILDTHELVRISLYIYNNKQDVDKLIQALKDFKKEDILNGII